MLKRKLLMTVLPLLTAGVLVGSGFSSWVFGEGSASDTKTGNIYVENYVENGLSLNVTAPSALDLDQGGVDAKTNTEKGIQFGSYNTSFTANGSLTIEVTKDATSSVTNCDIVVTFSTDSSLDTYLAWASDDLSSGSTTASRSNGVFTFNDVAFSNNEATLTLDLNDSNGHNKIWDYNDKPDTTAEWQNLNNAVTNDSRKTFSIKVDVTSGD